MERRPIFSRTSSRDRSYSSRWEKRKGDGLLKPSTLERLLYQALEEFMKFPARHMALALAAIAVTASFPGCATNKARNFTSSSSTSSTSAVLRGMVYNENRMPVQDVTVSRVDADTTKKTA